MSYAPSDDYAPDGRLTPAVLWLMALAVGTFFVQVTVQQGLATWLGFDRATLAAHPWTPVTYLFVHAGFWHLALNMYSLWVFGGRVERAMGTRSFTGFYLWCGLGGVVAHALLSPEAALVGASGAIFGVLWAYARRWPDEEVLLFLVVPMKVKWMVWFLIATNLISGLLAASGGGGDRIAYFAHLGGIAFAVLWLLRPSAPSVDRLRQRVAAVPDLGDDPPRPIPRSLPRPRERGSEADEAVERSKAITATPPPPPPRPIVRPPTPRPRPAPAATRDGVRDTARDNARDGARDAAAQAGVGGAASRATALDLVLDKISRTGMASLSGEERRVLEEESRRLRDG